MTKTASDVHEIVNTEQGEAIDCERARELAGAAARMSSCEYEDSQNAALIELILGIAQIESASDRHFVAQEAVEIVYTHTANFGRAFNKFTRANWGKEQKGVIG